MTLKTVLNILLRRWYVIAICLVSTVIAAFIALKVIPPRFEGKATVIVDPGQIDPATGQAGAFGSRAALTSLVALANSQKLAELVFDKLGYENDPALIAQYRESKAFGRLSLQEWGGELVAAGLTATPSFDGSNILVFTYKSSNSVQASSAANVFANTFVSLALDLRRSSALQTMQWLDPQIDKLKSELIAAQNRLADYRKAENVLPAAAGQDGDTSLLNAITSQLSQSKSDALKLETLLAAKNVDDSALAQAASSPLLDSLKGQLVSTSTDLARAEADVGAHNAKVVSLNAIRQAVRQQIDAETTQIRHRLGDRLANYKQQIAFLEKQLKAQTAIVIQQQAKTDQMNNLARGVDIDQEQLNLALRTSSTARMQSQVSFSNLSLLDTAVPPETPAFPKKRLIMAAAFGGGLFLGMIFALLAEIADRRIRTVDDLAHALRMTQPTMLRTAY